MQPKQSWAVFDLDGTLMDSHQAILASFRLAFEAHGVQPAPDQAVSALIGLPLTRMFQTLLPAKPDLHPSLIRSYSDAYPGQERQLGRVFPGALPLLQLLRTAGWGIAIATSKSAAGLDRVLAQTPLGDWVDIRGSNDRAVRPKPDPAMLQWVLTQADAEPSQAVMVGDTTFDVEMGQRAGVRSIGVTWGAHSRTLLEPFADEVVDDFNGLRRCLGAAT